jgi:hypothetical protein
VSDAPAPATGGARRHVALAAVAVLAVYGPYAALVVIDRSCEHCLWTLLKISPVAPGLIPTSLPAAVAPVFMVSHEGLRMGLAGLVALAQVWFFARWALRGSRWSAPLAFAVNLPMGIMLAHLLRA